MAMFFMIRVLWYCLKCDLFYSHRQEQAEKKLHLKSLIQAESLQSVEKPAKSKLTLNKDRRKERNVTYDTDYEVKSADSCHETHKSEIKCAICGKDITRQGSHRVWETGITGKK